MKSSSQPLPYLSVVIPVYRSEDCLETLIAGINRAMAPLGRYYEVVMINDCSPDHSWTVISWICQSNPNVVGIDLRRNFSQDNAIITGLRMARGKYVAIMDDDLQHDPQDLPRLLAKIEEGADVVYANFDRRQQSWWKNLGSWFNGKVAEWVLGKPKGFYLSPYKVMRKEISDLICVYDGPDPYIDGLIFQVTSNIDQIPAKHYSRHAGRSTYTLWKSLKVWARLAFSFSVRPVRFVTTFGFIFAALGLVLVLVVTLYRILAPQDFPAEAVGWASLMVALLMIGGIQMIFFGILGEYIGRTYLKVNNKPQTSIRQILNPKPDSTLTESTNALEDSTYR
jgi:polyisoprenyl-phosphate glycosyltransferase